MALTLVQSAFARNNGSPTTITLAAAPTLGNQILAIYVGRNAGLSLFPALALAEIDQGNFNSYQGTQCWVGPVTAGMSATFTVTGMSDWGNIAVFEIGGAASNLNVLANACVGTGTTVTTFPLTANADPNGLNLLALAWDNGVGVSTNPTGWTLLSPTTWQNTGNYHDGAIFEIPNTTAGVQSIPFNGSMDSQGAVMLNVQLWTPAGAPSIGKTLWDANNRGAVGFSDGSLIIGGGLMAFTYAGTGNIRATRQLTSMLSYWEVTISQLPSSMSLGVCTGGFNITGTTLLGADSNSIGFEQNGSILLNNAVIATVQPYAQGNVVQVAVDLANRLIWFNVNGGNWNNAATNNPATGVGGISLSGMSAFSNIYPAFGAQVASSDPTVVANFTGPFAYAPPAGFVSVDLTTVGSTVNLGQFVSDAMSAGANGPSQYAPFGNGQLGGSGHISGAVQNNGVAAAKIIRLYDESSGWLLGAAVSDPATGAYSISGMGRTQVYAVAFDTPNDNALILDNLTPV